MIDHPLGWSLEQRLAHCYKMVEKLIDRHPAIAYVWYKAAGQLEVQIAHTAAPHPDDPSSNM
jgi:hypothetical protein